MAGDNNRLYFKNYERRPDDEEFAEVMKILKEEGAIISDKYIAPDCDWYHNCIIGEGVLIFFIRLMEKEHFCMQRTLRH